jgi:CSLREA domain-containing protein
MNRKSYRSLYLAALLLLALVAAAPPAQAAVFIPTKLTDGADGACDSDCSLREAVLAANAQDGPDFIVLGVGTYTLSLTGAGEDLAATGDLDVRDDLAIVGRDAANTVLDGTRIDRVLDVQAGARLELVGVSVTRGFVQNEQGGGIRVLGELALTRGIVVRNEAAGAGGGLYLEEGTVSLTNSTVSHNVALLGGGGIHATSRALGTVSNSTIAFNSAGNGKGGGVLVENEPFLTVEHPVFKNSIVAANDAASERDCSGSALSDGHNLLGDGSGCLDFGHHPGDLEGTAATPLDPKLFAELEAGGPTPAHAPKAGSPALGHGSGCEAVDQRGADRPESSCDIGAIELTAQCVTGGNVLCLRGGRFQVQLTWTTATGSGPGRAVQLTDESGYYTFFDPSNVELTLKVLNGCPSGPRGRYWVFMSGLTNVGVQVTVTDTLHNRVKTYANPLNQTFQPVLDTNAFATCP